ncbi:cytosine permease [Vibrio taketomensis]|uniref:cytosine permease n=1 Tax=Vibrio taketomensis TaxID=2572923 RepID=UPI00138990FC|nr:cytosine permease [Vibrio taketomensis]
MKENENLINNPVPMDQRIGWKAPLINFLGCNIALSELMVGGALIAGMSVSGLVTAAIIGNLILIVVATIQGNIAAREGLNTYVLATGAFGKKGGVWMISLLLGFTSFGWFGIQAGVAGLSIQQIFPSVNLTFATIVLGLLMMIVAVYGFSLMAKFNAFALPPLILLMIYGLYKAMSVDNSIAISDYQPLAENAISMLDGINLVVGVVIVGAVISPDYLRYTRNVKDVAIIAIVGIGFISFIQQLSAGIMAINSPTWDITAVMADLGMGWGAFLVLLLAAWSTNLSNAYSGGLALKNIFPDVNRSTLTLVAGLIGTALAASGLIFKFQMFLSVLSIAVPAVAGVMWAEYYLIQGKKFVQREGFNWFAVGAWVLGFAVSMLSNKYGFGLPPVNAILVSGIAYWLVMSRLEVAKVQPQ